MLLATETQKNSNGKKVDLLLWKIELCETPLHESQKMKKWWKNFDNR